MVFVLLLGLVGLAEAQSTPFTLSVLRANNGEFITRSRTVKLNIVATSTQGKITGMSIGNSVINRFDVTRSYTSSLTYSFPATAVGRQFIAVRLSDIKGNVSPQYDLFVDILPDFPVLPALTLKTPPSLSLRRGNTSSVILSGAVNDPGSPIVQMSTVLGDILLQLNPTEAPLTVANFLKYVDSNAYDGSFFHRSIPGFIIQGGGWNINFNEGNRIEKLPTFGTVLNEPDISNTRGTIAMAKVDEQPNSATSEWFFNLADNSENLDNQNEGFTVFGKVLDTSLTVMDGIAARPRTNQGTTLGFQDLPVLRAPAAGQLPLLQDLIYINTASRFRFSVVKPITGAKTRIVNNTLFLEPGDRPASGQQTITIRAATADGRTFDFPVAVDLATNHPMLAGGVGTRSVRATEDTPTDISVTVSNPDNSPLQYSFNPAPTKGTCVLLDQTRPGIRVFRYTPNPNANGTENFTIRVVDANVDPQKSGSDSLAIQMQITAVNDLPVITAPPTVSASAGDPFEFDVSVSDVETSPESLILTAIPRGIGIVPGSLSIEGTGATRKVKFTAAAVTAPTTGTIRFTLSDSNRGRRLATVSFNVVP